MAAGDSPLSICNIALFALGEMPMTAFPDSGSKRGILATARYDDCRRFTLRNHPWNCATKYGTLGALASGVETGDWASAYALPTDYIRLLRVKNCDEFRYEVRSGFILTNETAPVKIEYIWDIQDATKFDADLIHAVAYTIASEIAIPLTQSKSKRDDALAILGGKLEVGRFASSQENSPREFDDDVMLRSRG